MVKIDIELPKYCYDCPCHNGENGRCNITGDSTFDKRPFDCPLKEVKLADLQSAQPERKKGKWLRDPPEGGYALYKCSVCGKCWLHWWASAMTVEEMTKEVRCCPHCGADMREEKTDE